jgi:hypothetical protein
MSEWSLNKAVAAQKKLEAVKLEQLSGNSKSTTSSAEND